MLQLLSLRPAEAQKEHQKRLLQYRQFYNNNNNNNNNKNDDDDDADNDDSQTAIFSVPYTNMQLLHFSNIPRIFMYVKNKKNVHFCTFSLIRTLSLCISPNCKALWDVAALNWWASMSCLIKIRVQPGTIHLAAFFPQVCWCMVTWALQHKIIMHARYIPCR